MKINKFQQEEKNIKSRNKDKGKNNKLLYNNQKLTYFYKSINEKRNKIVKEFFIH